MLQNAARALVTVIVSNMSSSCFRNFAGYVSASLAHLQGIRPATNRPSEFAGKS